MGSRTSGRRLAGADAARHKIVVCVVLVVMALYWFSWTLIDDSSWRLIKAPSLSRPPGRLVARRSNTDMTVDELKDVTLDLRRVTRELKRIRSSTAGDGATGACRVELASPPCESPRRQEQESFTAVYKKQVWGTTHGSHTRSGSGSTIRGAFDTIFELENFMQEHNITSIADVPSGDCGWQFSVASINAARCYFGGDIVKHVVEANAERYEAHSNKVFQFWDFVSCPIPRWRTTCDLTPRPFDMVLSRDVIQHLRLDSSLEAVRKIVRESGATYFAVTTFNSTCQECWLGNSVDEDGGFYLNNMHCPPWNFPEPILRFESHRTFPEEEYDFMEVYQIADLKPVVEKWPASPCR